MYGKISALAFHSVNKLYPKHNERNLETKEELLLKYLGIIVNLEQHPGQAHIQQMMSLNTLIFRNCE